MGGAWGLLCILLCQWLLGIHLKKVTSGGFDFQSGPHKLSASSCNNLCVIGIDDFMDIGNNILDRKRRKREREGMLNRTF